MNIIKNVDKVLGIKTSQTQYRKLTSNFLSTTLDVHKQNYRWRKDNEIQS